MDRALQRRLLSQLRCLFAGATILHQQAAGVRLCRVPLEMANDPPHTGETMASVKNNRRWRQLGVHPQIRACLPSDVNELTVVFDSIMALTRRRRRDVFVKAAGGGKSCS